MNFNSHVWLQYEEQNLLADYWEVRPNRIPTVKVTREVFEMLHPEAKSYVLRDIIEKEVKYREHRVGPLGGDTWNKSWDEEIKKPFMNHDITRGELRNKIVEWFQAIPEMTNSPIFCYKTLEIFTQHKDDILKFLDTPICFSEILTMDATAIYNHLLGIGVVDGGEEEDAAGAAGAEDIDMEVGGDEDVLSIDSDHFMDDDLVGMEPLTHTDQELTDQEHHDMIAEVVELLK
jgi:hypothetical protein